jgi:cytochrome c oxidase assembly protein subunit 15
MSKRQSVLARSPGAPPPERRPSHSHRPLRGVAIAATATTFLLIGIGALVRATGSGLGCSGWPKCTPGRWLPPLEHHAIIEYSHRMTAFVDIVLVAVLVVIAWRGYRSVPRVFRASLAAAALIVVQAVLGGIVVKGDLAALLVTAHFGAAMVLAAALVYATVAAFTIDAGPAAPPDPLTTLARVAAAAAFALLVVGAYVRGENAGLAFTDWPLMQGRLVPHLGSVGPALMFAHRVLAVATAVLVAMLSARAWRQRASRRPVAVLALSAAALYLGQVGIGAALVWSLLSAPARVAHVTVAGLIWGALVAAAATARVVPLGASPGRRTAAVREDPP